MSILPTSVLPKVLLRYMEKKSFQKIQVSPELIGAAKQSPDEVFQKLQSSPQGLTQEEAQRRLEQYGPNTLGQEKQHTRLKILGKAVINPLVILLLALATVTYLTAEEPSDQIGAYVMLLMVVLAVTLRFAQELRADSAAAKLKAMIKVTATVVRDGQASELPLGELVPGDVIKLAAGDMIPADVRLISCKDLFLIQSVLTGESMPSEKFSALQNDNATSPVDLTNLCFLGTTVETGSATALVVATGARTYMGSMASAIVTQQVQTSFDKGVSRFIWLMLRFMMVMVPLVFLINGLTKHNWKDAFFFALAVAVGLTPEMLPMIITVCLSKGALAMSRKKVIVKRLHSIQNFGAMDVLCTDKTGTLTMDHVILEKHFDVFRKENDEVMAMAYLNSYFQTGLKNVLDRAILSHEADRTEPAISGYEKADEIPFDFQRKVMSVVVKTPDGRHRLIAKGASEEIFRRCSQFEYAGKFYPMEKIFVDDMREEHNALCEDGFRVLAVAYKDLEQKNAYSKEDEKDLVLKGYMVFLDPPKESAGPALVALQKHGIAVKVLTGDNELVTCKICHEVGLPTDMMLLGGQVETMTDEQLGEAAEKTTVFARLSPAHKQRVIKALQSRQHVVGFLGDGINDAPALRAADVGISVDTAVDIAKESADVILLEKSLLVLEEGVLEGRKVFANIIKYVRMGASSNFGNMFSVLGASLWLPFLPMLPLQILTNNLLYDFSQVAIPTDEVDPEQIAKPRPWTMGEISRFIIFIGPISSIFDYTTYFMMFYLFKCKDMAGASLFQTGWFVESLLTQTLIIHVIRTNKIPFIQSRASWPLILTTATVMAIGMYLPFSPIAKYLGFTPLPGLFWPLLLLTLLCYIVLTQVIKVWLIRKTLI
jgi:Mg2+-importing ATPase